MRVNVKPLTHWIIYKSYSVRFTSRTPTLVTGLLTTPDGTLRFEYEPTEMLIQLHDEQENTEASITINEYGWEIES